MAKSKGRKNDHIRITLKENVRPGYNYWNDVKLVHEALPEVDYDKIDTSADFLGSRIAFPFIVTAMTGGFEGAKKINKNIAEACSELGIGMGVGSQRAAIEGTDRRSFEVIKDYDLPVVIGNIGAAQLIEQRGKGAITKDDIDAMIDMIDADFIAVHLNFAQELVQPEGDTRAKGCFEKIREYARSYPLIAKETGCGMSGTTSKRLYDVGVKAVDISGMGGTSFPAIEMFRSLEGGNMMKTEIGSTFFDWGIPATVSLLCTEGQIPTIASGGINTGLDIAKAVAMGAMCAGGSNVVLRSAMESSDAVKEVLDVMREEFRTAMMLTGCGSVKELSQQEYVLLGETKEWMDGCYE